MVLYVFLVSKLLISPRGYSSLGVKHTVGILLSYEYVITIISLQ